MKKHEAENPPDQALAGAFADISDIFRSASSPRDRSPDVPSGAADYRKARTIEGRPPEINELDALMHKTAVHYQQLEREARSLLGDEIALPSIVQTLRQRGVSPTGLLNLPEAMMAAMVSLFGRASATFLPIVVPLAGRMEAGTIALYEPYERGFHPASARTSIGTISGDWVRKPSDEIVDTPDIVLDLEYAHGDPSPRVIVELTWVGRETVTASGGTTWSSTPLVSGSETIALKVRSLAMAPTMDGWVKLPLTVNVSGTMSVRYDVWLRTTASETPGPVEDDDDGPIVAPTPLPLPVPSPTPTGIPNDILAALDPDRWRRIEDRLGQFVRDTLGAFEGVLSRVDIMTDRAVLRDVSAALRERR